ncbi:LamG-like jellyroll fold domain-containing protein [Labedaea rhizosphaerae]|uniref:RHS repeat-associated protein n=1 Tax=Labedaea rhizosphaerae TaxID=598644 RepID=A0A4R6RUH8_LABRH|nr:LamG-like jellyroll fold domain-containing protein [Labedaea rhizosphaerae]TDP90560.1 RHS repeat-associated protein [Labedaea rhizosphaerae]
MTRNGGPFFTDEQIAPAVLALRVIDVPPVIKEQYPPNGYSAPTLTPSLWAKAVDIDAPPNSSLQYRFQICEPGEVNCFDSGRQPNTTWTVPLGKLVWGRTYQWRVFAFDGTSENQALPFSNLLTAVPQPEITAQLGNAPYSGRSGEFDPQVGNYTSSAVDATVSTVGPQLSVVRTYNSLDPRRDTAFGAGWSSQYDMRVVPDADGSGNVVVTYPDGQQARFGANLTVSGLPAAGTLVAPQGRYAILVPRTGGGWDLTDKSATRYVFDANGHLTEIHDNAGRWLSYSYVDGHVTTILNHISNRALHLTWIGGHVHAVNTDSVNGQSLLWTYVYDGDRLTQACDPTNHCTTYGYTAGTHYRNTVLDSRPDSYWRLSDADSPDAYSQVAINLGADKGHYIDVTPGTPGAIAGTTDAAATFNGTTSAITMPDGAVRRSREFTAELWFRTATGGPLLGVENTPYGATPSKSVPTLYIGTDGKLRGQLWTGQIDPITTTGAVTDNGWHHVVLTGSLTTQSLYLDGNLVGTRTGVIDHSAFTYSQIGAAYAVTPASWPQWGAAQRRSFAGDIDEVAVYQRPLGLPAVRTHFAARAASDQINSVVLPSGKTAAELTYDLDHDRVDEYIDRNGGTWRLGTPNVSGDPDNIIRTVRVTDPANRDHFYEYDPVRGRILRYLAPLGTETRPEDNPPPTTDPVDPPPDCPPDQPFCEVPTNGGPGSFPPVDLQGARTFDYDANGYQSAITDENGNTIALGHDARGNVTTRTTCRTGPTDCQTSYYEYYPVGTDLTDPRLDKVIATRDARSSGPTDNRYRTAFTYTSRGDLETQTTADNAVVRHTYTADTTPAYDGGTAPAGLLATSTDPRNAVTTYAYYRNGDLAQVTSPTGLITRYIYDELGRRVSATQISDSYPQGITSTTAYDDLSRPAVVTAPTTTNAVTGDRHTERDTTTYDPDGNATAVDSVDIVGTDQPRTTRIDYDEHNRVERVTDPEGNETSFGYDSFGNTTRMVNADGVQYEYAYTARNKLAEVRLRGWNGDPDGAQPGPDDYLVVDSYAYDLAGQLVRHVDAMGRATRYSYYNDGLPYRATALGVHNPDGSTRDVVLTTNTFDAAGNPSKQTFAGGRVTTYEIDAVGRRTATTADPDGLRHRTELAYDLSGNVTRVNMTGRESNTGAFDDLTVAETVDYGYDPAGRRTSETVNTGTETLATRYGYDQRNLLTSVTDPRGTAAGADPAAFTTNYQFDELGEATHAIAPPVAVETNGGAPTTARPTTKIGYDTFGDATHTTDANSNTWLTGYDRLGRPTSTTSPDYTAPGATQPIRTTTGFAYDGLGQITAVTGPRGAVTSYDYDQLGRLTKQIDPDPTNPGQPGGEWQFTYTRTGEPLSVTDPTGARVESTYDDLGRLATSSELERYPTPGTYTSHYGYDDAGNLTSSTTPANATSAATYDALNQLIRTTSAAGVTTQFGYDRSGRQVRTADAAGRAHRINVDLAGRPIQELDTGPTGRLVRQSKYAYDQSGNLGTYTDPLSHVTQFDHDALGRLTRQVEPVSAGHSITTSFGYDAAGNLTRQTDGRGNSTITTANSWGLPESVVEPATTAQPNLADRTWTASYDASANVTTLTEPGGVRRDRTFDLLDNLRHETGTGAEGATTDRTYAYDALSRVSTSSAPDGTDTFTYNDRGALLTTTGPSGATTFGYNADGNVTSRTDASGTSTYGYISDRLSSIRDPLTGNTKLLTYDTAGLPKTESYGTNVRTFGYDDLARLKTDTLTTSSGNTVASLTYGYDNANRLTSKAATGLAGTASSTYDYDYANRLTSWTHDSTTTAYGWDDAGNRTTAGGKTATYDERNRLLTDGTSTYTYTPRGTQSTKVTGSATQHLEFDAFDRLTTADTAHYSYDSLDRVATRNQQRFTYSGASNALVSDGTTTIARGPAREPIATKTGATGQLALTDQHTDVVASVDATTGQLTGSTGYDPFGTPTGTTGTTGRLGYQGGYTDPDTGQVNMSARWYDPGTAAFTSRDDDPAGGVNRYGYASGSPLNYTDPTGHTSVCAVAYGTSSCNGTTVCALYPYCPGSGSNGSSGGGSSGSCSGGLGVLTFGCGGCSTPPGVQAFGCSGGSSGGSGGAVGAGLGGLGGGSGRGGGGSGGRGGGGGGHGPGPDVTQQARAANRAAARDNPLPIPAAMTAPLYGGSIAPPVSSAPDVPSRTSSDYQNPVQDINKSYDNLQDSLTVDNTVLLGKVSDTVAGATGVTNVNYEPPGVTPPGAGGGLPGNPFPITSTPPSKDYTTRHNFAVDVAIVIIRGQVAAAGGDPSKVTSGFKIPGASKNGTGNAGYADITYDDGQNLWVWEVKSAGQGAKAGPEAQWYVDQYNKLGLPLTAQKGWSIGGPYPGVNNDRVVGVGPGAIIYHGDTLPRRSPIPVPDPVPVPLPIYVPSNDPAPDTGGGFWDWITSPEVLTVGGAILFTGLACASGVGCAPAIAGSTVVLGTR